MYSGTHICSVVLAITLCVNFFTIPKVTANKDPPSDTTSTFTSATTSKTTSKTTTTTKTSTTGTRDPEAPTHKTTGAGTTDVPEITTTAGHFSFVFNHYKLVEIIC